MLVQLVPILSLESAVSLQIENLHRRLKDKNKIELLFNVQKTTMTNPNYTRDYTTVNFNRQTYLSIRLNRNNQIHCC